jgi:hypothetical protein
VTQLLAHDVEQPASSTCEPDAWESAMTITSTMAVLAAATILMASSTIESAEAPQARYIDPITGDPEKDSFGFMATDLNLQPRATVWLSQAGQYVGARMGTDEKDTFARVEVQPTLSADLVK